MEGAKISVVFRREMFELVIFEIIGAAILSQMSVGSHMCIETTIQGRHSRLANW
jgi:hypothetical protein